MQLKKQHWAFVFLFVLIQATLDWRTSINISKTVPNTEINNGRFPANVADIDTNDCKTIIKNFFISKNYEVNHSKALINKKLISFTNKFVTIQHPRMDWINRVRSSLNKSLRNWNNNRYPAFYLFNDEEIVPVAKNYFDSLDKILREQLPLAKEQTENQALVNAWIKSYKDYNTDVDNLLNERISLQYNLSLLKKLKLKDETRDIKLQVMKSGTLVEEIITLHKEDKNLGHLVKRFKAEIGALDGTLLKNGKIKDRIVRQAMLSDILTILHRELEYSIKNSPTPHEGMLKELENLQALIKNAEFKPTTYGVYQVTNKVFIREVMAMAKLDVLYKIIKDPVTTVKDLFVNFLKNRSSTPVIDGPEKIGIFKRVYNKITSITPKQAAYGSGTASVLAFGYYRYFWLKEDSLVELKNQMTDEEIEPAHQEQLARTQAEDVRKSEGHSEVIEVMIEELTN